MSDFFRRYLLAGFVFQSVVIGGGYATGRELIEFFMPAGPVGGLLGMGVTMLVWGAVMAVSFELVRLTRSYDYKSFFTMLLGRGWFLFEIAYILLLILVLSVLGAASGEIVNHAFGLPRLAGTLALLLTVAGVVFYGNTTVEKVLAALGAALYAVYIIFFVWCVLVFGDRIAGNFSAASTEPGWFTGGLRYAGYNMAVIPAVLFCVRHMKQRREAIASGLLGGPLAMLPGCLFYIALMGFYPGIGEHAVPSNFLLDQLGAPWFAGVFQLVVFGTLVATGAGLLHAINERVSRVYAERTQEMPRWMRPAISLTLMAISVFAATAVGLIGLIAQGYGALTWLFIALLVVPVLTIGVWRIYKMGRTLSQPPAAVSGGA